MAWNLTRAKNKKNTHLDVSLKLSKLNSSVDKNEHKKMQSCDYWGISGCLKYLALKVDQILRIPLIHWVSCWNNVSWHWNAATECSSGYLIVPKDKKMTFQKSENLELTGLSKSHKIGNINSRESAGGLVSNLTMVQVQSFALQKCVCTSIAEIELSTVVGTSREVVHFTYLIRKKI